MHQREFLGGGWHKCEKCKWQEALVLALLLMNVLQLAREVAEVGSRGVRGVLFAGGVGVGARVRAEEGFGASGGCGCVNQMEGI